MFLFWLHLDSHKQDRHKAQGFTQAFCACSPSWGLAQSLGGLEAPAETRHVIALGHDHKHQHISREPCSLRSCSLSSLGRITPPQPLTKCSSLRLSWDLGINKKEDRRNIKIHQPSRSSSKQGKTPLHLVQAASRDPDILRHVTPVHNNSNSVCAAAQGHQRKRVILWQELQPGITQMRFKHHAKAPL